MTGKSSLSEVSPANILSENTQSQKNKREHRPLLGIVLMIAAMVLVPFLDIFAKLLTEDYSVIQVTWVRFAFHVFWLVILLSILKRRWWRLPSMVGRQLLRSLFLTGATVCFFLSIADNPIPTALALLFVSPIVVAAVAPFWLKEAFDLPRLVGVLVGFLGVIIVLQPGTFSFSPTLLWALLAGISYALYLMATRWLSAAEGSSLSTLLHTAVGGLVVLTPFVFSQWQTPDLQGLGMMAAMGFFAAAGHYLIIRACQYASASQLSPFNYFEIVTATVLSYLLFDFWPEWYVWVGLLIICASGLYVTLREAKQANI